MTAPESTPERACLLQHTFPALREVGLSLPKTTVVCHRLFGHAGSHEGYGRGTTFVWSPDRDVPRRTTMCGSLGVSTTDAPAAASDPTRHNRD
jgi:hypothetical protein